MKINYKDRITTIYALITQMRKRGIKMKEIAEQSHITSSLLSALYSTVLPAFIEKTSKGVNDEIAIEEALGQVNNISRKKFHDILEILEKELAQIDYNIVNPANDKRLFFGDIEREAIKCISQAHNYSGIYWAYSRSSYKDALKIEPYIIQDVQKGEIMPKICFSNEMEQEYWGVALFSVHQLGYMFINEQKNMRLGLRIISLQLPLFDKPSVLKGTYMSHDYNHNPIARRVVFVKYSDSTNLENFQCLKAKTISSKDLTDEEKNYYEYTCFEGDYIRSLMYASPVPNREDLVREKLMLKL